MNIAEILNKPIILSNKYIIEINELRKIEDNDDIPDAIAYVLSAKIKIPDSGERRKMNDRW